MAAILDPIAGFNLQEFVARKMTTPAALAQQKKGLAGSQAFSVLLESFEPLFLLRLEPGGLS